MAKGWTEVRRMRQTAHHVNRETPFPVQRQTRLNLPKLSGLRTLGRFSAMNFGTFASAESIALASIIDPYCRDTTANGTSPPICGRDQAQH